MRKRSAVLPDHPFKRSMATMTQFGNCSCFTGLGAYPPSDEAVQSGPPAIVQFPNSVVSNQNLIQDFDRRTRYLPEIGTRVWEVTGTQIYDSALYYDYPAWFDLRVTAVMNAALFLPGDDQITRSVTIATREETTGETEDVLSISTTTRGFVYDESIPGYPLQLIGGVWQEDRSRISYYFPPSTSPPPLPPHSQSWHIRFLETTNHRFRVTTTVSNGWHVVGSVFAAPPTIPSEDPMGQDDEYPSYYRVRKLLLC